MTKQTNSKNANEQSKAQKLFEQWRKEEPLYKEDEKAQSNQSDQQVK